MSMLSKVGNSQVYNDGDQRYVVFGLCAIPVGLKSRTAEHRRRKKHPDSRLASRTPIVILTPSMVDTTFIVETLLSMTVWLGIIARYRIDRLLQKKALK